MQSVLKNWPMQFRGESPHDRLDASSTRWKVTPAACQADRHDNRFTVRKATVENGTMTASDLLLSSLDSETVGSCWVYGMAMVSSPRTKVTRFANPRQNWEAMGKLMRNQEGTDDNETIVVVMSIQLERPSNQRIDLPIVQARSHKHQWELLTERLAHRKGTLATLYLTVQRRLPPCVLKSSQRNPLLPSSVPDDLLKSSSHKSLFQLSLAQLQYTDRCSAATHHGSRLGLPSMYPTVYRVFTDRGPGPLSALS